MRSMPKIAGWTSRCTTPWGVGLVFAVAFVVLAISMNREISLYDEGVILTGSTRVMEGAVPHRDFYVPYGPAQFSILALLFKIFGPSVLVERLWDVLMKAAAVACAFLIGKRLTTANWSLVTSALCVVWLSYIGVPGWPVWPALFILMVEANLMLSVFDGATGAGRLIAAGVCVGLATLFRYDIGFLILASESTVLLLYCQFRKENAGERLRKIAIVLAQFWGGTALVCVPVAIAYLVWGSVGDFWFDVVAFPMRFYAAMRGLPLPSQFFSGLSAPDTEYIVYLPLAAVIASIVALLNRNYFLVAENPDARGADADSHPLRWKLGLLTAIMLAFYAKAYVRVSAVHVGLALVVSFITLAVVASAYTRRRPSLVAIALGFALLVGILPTLHAAGHVALAAVKNISWLLGTDRSNPALAESGGASGSCRPAPGLERTSCFVLGPDQTKTVLYLQARLAPGQPIFVGLLRHDRIVANDVGFYFVSKLRPITKWYQFDPGLQTSAFIQIRIVGDLERIRPTYVVLDSTWEHVIEQNESAVSSGVLVLDHYIVDHYQRVATFGTCFVLKRKSENAAAE
jgi:Dolichyl-phosphate-mannose-protein mannosyltransferase